MHRIFDIQIQFTSLLKPDNLNTHITSKSIVIDPNKCKVLTALTSYIAQNDYGFVK